jgi:hypothetical protein
MLATRTGRRRHGAVRSVWVAVLAALVWTTAAAPATAAPTPTSAPAAVAAVPAQTVTGLGDLACGILGTLNPVSGLLCGSGQAITGGALQDQPSGEDGKQTSSGSSLVCTVAPVINPLLGLVCPVLVDGVESVAKIAGLVLNPERAYQHFANDLKEDAITWFTRSMTYVVNETTFNPGAQWWREAYAATAGIGMSVMVAMILLTLRRASVGKIGPAKAREVVTQYVPVAVMMMIFGPPVGHVLMRITGGMNAGIIGWMGTDAVAMLTNGAAFSQLTVASGFGIGMGILMFGVLLLATLGVFGTFIAQTLSTYVLGAVGGLAWGMSVDPAWRPKALKVLWLVLGLIFAKPAGLLVIAIITKYLANLNPNDTLDDPTQLLVQGLTFIIALVMIAFSPWAVMKFFPLLPDGTESVNSSGPTAATAVAGGMGSIATTMLMLHSRGGASGGGGGGGGGRARAEKNAGGPNGASKPKSGGQNQGPGSDKQREKNRSDSGQKDPSRSGGGKGSGAQGTGPSGASDPATATSPAAKGASGLGSRGAGGAAGGGVAGGGQAAASGAGGAATGGALLAAQLAAAGVTAVTNKAKEASAAAAPQTGGGER